MLERRMDLLRHALLMQLLLMFRGSIISMPGPVFVFFFWVRRVILCVGMAMFENWII